MNNRISILVIEDDSDISSMICDLLKRNGYNAKPVYSGTEALMVFNNKVDLDVKGTVLLTLYNFYGKMHQKRWF
ncbi:DNA-binding response OmpR family regulator [Anaerosolibacter carboniphilus]|uniref:DNA-binding response OmpR family regulator n=1 Tax=Anaerosolibacter carboniphilus TaxID=1417629 RepID=A0A841KUK5_9FIRM|nr:hypothetical protein [Anaerosolibacter carboniphilus]MBB6215878.1 DNA-binding response OmpR family regulator [Anaerosolibacter carboniphilus]